MLYGDFDWPLVSFPLWLTAWAFVPPVFVAPCLIALLFPTGRPLTPRWRYAVWFVAAGLIVAPFGGAFASGLSGYPDVENPAAFPVLEDIASVVDSVGKVTLAPTMLLLALTSIVLRFRRSRGVERLQLKWVASAGSVMVAGFFLAFVSGQTAISDIGFVTGVVGFVLLPIAVGVAILRYRLFDIDRVISKTLVYAALSLVLGALVRRPGARRAGALLVVRGQLEPGDRGLDAGGGGTVPAGALAGAALRRPALLPAPLRRARTLESFGARLREQVELVALERDLRDGRHRDDAAGARVGVAEEGSAVRRPWTTWLAWGLWCVTAALFAVGATLQHVAGDQALDTSSLTTKLGLLVAFLGFATVGSAVASPPAAQRGRLDLPGSRLPCLSSRSRAGSYVNYSFNVRAEPLPGTYVAAWVYLWAWFPAIGLIAFLPLLFPDGRVPGRRWRPVLWALGAVLVEMTVTSWFLPGSMNDSAKPPWPPTIRSAFAPLKPL